MSFKLSQHAQEVIVHREIREEWIWRTLNDFGLRVEVSETEVHYFLTIPENNHRCLKVVVNPVNGIVVTAYFDRNMRKRGCK